MQNKSFDAFAIEMEHAGFAVVDPDNGVGMVGQCASIIVRLISTQAIWNGPTDATTSTVSDLRRWTFICGNY